MNIYFELFVVKPASIIVHYFSYRSRLAVGIIIVMKLTLAEVEHIAELARLELTAAEKELYRQQLSAILDYAAKLQSLDTSGIPPTASVLPPRSVLRPDVVHDGLTTDEVLRNASQTTNNQFRVPPVLE